MVATELAVLFPIILFLILLMTQAIFWVHAKSVARTAADVAAEEAALITHVGDEQSAATTAANNVLGSTQSLNNPAIVVTINGANVTVTISGKSTSVLGSWGIEESVTIPLEGAGR